MLAEMFLSSMTVFPVFYLEGGGKKLSYPGGDGGGFHSPPLGKIE